MLKTIKEILRYIKYYRFNSIYLRNFVIILIMLMIPFLSVNYMVYRNNDVLFKKETETSNEVILSNMKQAIDSKLSEMDRLGIQLLASDDIEFFTKVNYEAIITYEKKEKIEKLQETFNLISATYDFIDSIYLYSYKSDYAIGAMSGGLSRYIHDLEWLKKYNSNELIKAWNVVDIDGKLKLAFTSGVKYSKDEVSLIVININLDKLISTINSQPPQQYDFIITDKNNCAVYDSDYKLISKKIDSKFLDNTSSQNGKSKTIISKMHSNENEWKYISIVPINEFRDIKDKYRTFNMILIISCIIIAIFLALVITIRSYEPINRIMEMIEGKKKKVNSNLNLTNKQNKEVIELKLISKALDESRMKSEMMNNELERRYELLKKAKTIALQAQINPHFLFNSLETINWKVLSLAKGNNEASKMIIKLSRLLRLSLNTDSNIVPIKEEVEHAKMYIDFQKLRFKDKFEVYFFIDPKVYDYCTINLMLQPIIENCIGHGINPSEGKHKITVSAKFNNEKIIFLIEDDGVGMSKEQVDNINKRMNEEYIKEEHIGLANVNQRIKIIFGDYYGIKVYSLEGKWTKVKIIIPKVNKTPLE